MHSLAQLFCAMYIPCKHFPSSTVLLLIYFPCFRFSFGNESTGAYAQLLSLTDKTTAAADFSTIRSQLLAAGPPELSPADLVQRLDGSLSTSTGDSGGGSQSAAAQLNVAANAPSPATDSKLSKYGPIVIGLLGANLALLLFVLCLGVSHLVRAGGRMGPQGARNAKYTPVKLREDRS